MERQFGLLNADGHNVTVTERVVKKRMSTLAFFILPNFQLYTRANN